MENLNAVNPSELPEGFSTVDPHNPSGGGGGGPQQQSQQQSEADLKKQAIAEQKQMVLEQALERDALARLSRIKMVKPAKAAQVENAIVAQAMSGKLPGPITEAKLIEILERKERATAQAVAASSSSSMGGGGGGGGNGIQIQRKQYNMDSDDEDDDDDV